MELQKGDWVRAEPSEVGKIVLITRLSAFVEFSSDKVSYLTSELTKIDDPKLPGSK